MMLSDFIYLFSIWLSTLVVGWVSWPSAAFFLGAFSDRGYVFAKFFGWIAVSYLVFLLATIKVIPLTAWSIILVAAVWAACNVFLEKKFKILRGRPFNLRQIIFSEMLFVALMVFWALIRSFKPEIYAIERFMDFGFIQALFNAHTLPLFDIWFSGESLNYYYFGHFIGYIILSVSHIPPLEGFFVLVAWMFGLLGAMVYRLGADFAHAFMGKTSMFAGILSLFTVLFAGTWAIIPWLLNSAKHLLFGGDAAPFWFADPTRIIPGTITEIPLYGFLVADLHPHMWGLLNGALVLAALYCAYRYQALLNFKSKYLWLLAMLLGTTYMLNSWDVLTLGMLTVAVAWYAHWHVYRIKKKVSLFFHTILLAGLAYTIALPWSTFYKAPIAGIGIVHERSPVLFWISFWGFLISTHIIFLLSSRVKKIAFYLIAVGVAALFLVLMEMFYVKDILRDGEWFRANTVFKITSQLWLWLGTLAGPAVVWTVLSVSRAKAKIALLIFYFLVFIPPLIYPVKAIHQFEVSNRKPTSFKNALKWWQDGAPHDYEAYKYMASIRDALPKGDKIRRIIEVEGDSYSDSARFSVFLGWPTIIGWPVHEWTWRGSYDEVGSRRSEVTDAYTSDDHLLTEGIIEKYKIDYIIIGELEDKRYGAEIKRDKLKSLGRVVFENERAMVIEVVK